MITVGEVAQAAIFALENGYHRKAYPLARCHISYKDFYKLILEEWSQSESTQLSLMSFDNLKDAYREDHEFTESKGIEHGIRQVNMLRANSLEFRLPTEVALDELRVKKVDIKKVMRETLHKANINP